MADAGIEIPGLGWLSVGAVKASIEARETAEAQVAAMRGALRGPGDAVDRVEKALAIANTEGTPQPKPPRNSAPADEPSE